MTVGDVVHGGAISALVDTTAMAAAWSMSEAPANLRGTTLSLSVDFVTAARAEDLTAVGRVIRRGRSLCFCEVEVRDADDQVVAIGIVTVFPPRAFEPRFERLPQEKCAARPSPFR